MLSPSVAFGPRYIIDKMWTIDYNTPLTPGTIRQNLPSPPAAESEFPPASDDRTDSAQEWEREVIRSDLRSAAASLSRCRKQLLADGRVDDARRAREAYRHVRKAARLVEPPRTHFLDLGDHALEQREASAADMSLRKQAERRPEPRGRPAF